MHSWKERHNQMHDKESQYRHSFVSSDRSSQMEANSRTLFGLQVTFLIVQAIICGASTAFFAMQLAGFFH
jgi:hypothetical protein